MECAKAADTQRIRGKIDDGVDLIAAAGEEAPCARTLVAGFQRGHEGKENPFFQQAGLAGSGIGGGVQRAADDGVGGGQGVDPGDPVAGGGVDDMQFDFDAVVLQVLDGQVGALDDFAGNGSIRAAPGQGKGNLRFRGRRRCAAHARHLTGGKAEGHDKQQEREGRFSFHQSFLCCLKPPPSGRKGGFTCAT